MLILRHLLVFFPLLLPVLCVAQGDYGPNEGQKKSVHGIWGQLLEQYVDLAGNVDYAGWNADKAALETYLNDLAEYPPQPGWSKNRRLAYFINLYNAATINLILEHYPVASIRDIKHPWSEKRIRMGDKKISLHYIEYGILRKMGEPRIHFAINCASVSCPDLLNVPFKEDTLEQQLEAVARAFINDPEKNRIRPETIALSPLFKWYKKDFIKNGSLRNFLANYSREPIDPKVKLEFLKYDWSLNEQ